MHFADSPVDMSGYLLGAVGHFTKRMHMSAPGKPVWMVLQGFGYLDLGDGPLLLPTSGSRRPTVAEARFMTYDAIVRGARGVLYWGTHHLERDSALWRGILGVANELAERQAILSAPDSDIVPEIRATAIFFPMNDGVHALGKKVGGKTLWLVVNEYAIPLTYTLCGLNKLEGTTYTVAETGKKATVKGGMLRLTIRPYEVQTLDP